MAGNTIGQFIAALRKANGMTQQDVADRLNVSNKSVSRWERNECAPDLSVIPALAEMFGVTCDELLRGERRANTQDAEMNSKKTEKQVKQLVNRTLSAFKTMIWISLAVAVVGLICMFGVSYGFYRPVIGFAVMLLFEACALIIAVLAVSRARDMKKDNEMFEAADESLAASFNNALGALSFYAFFVIFAVVVLSLPLIPFTSDYINSAVTPYIYFTEHFGSIVPILALVFLKCKAPFSAWISIGRLPEKQNGEIDKAGRRMSMVQLALTFLAGVLFVIAPFFDFNPETTFLFTAVVYLGFACLLANIVTFILFLLRRKTNSTRLLLPGIRNILLIPAAITASKWHGAGIIYDSPNANGIRYDFPNTEYILYTPAFVAAVFILFSFLEIVVNKRKKKE